MNGAQDFKALLKALWRHPALLFASVGVAGFFVDLSVLSLSLFAGAGPALARAISFSCAVTFTWYANRRLTFQSRDANWGREWIRFVIANSAGGALNLGVYSFAVWLIESAWAPYVGLVMGSFAGLTLNYLASRLWAFKRHYQRR